MLVDQADPHLLFDSVQEDTKLLVTLTAISGRRVLDISVERSIPILELKYRISNLWHVPPECQKLVLGESVLEDGRKLSSYCSDEDDRLDLVAMSQISHICNALLTEEDPRKRIESLGTIAKLGPKGGPAALDAISGMLHSEDASVRRAAVEALTQVGEKVDSAIIQMLMETLQDEDPDLRCAAVDALLKMASRENQEVVDAVWQSLRTQTRTCNAVLWNASWVSWR